MADDTLDNSASDDQTIDDQETGQEEGSVEDQKTDRETGEEESAKGYWPEDWREKYVESWTKSQQEEVSEKDKEKLSKRLSRYASPSAAMDALIAAQNKISSGKLSNVLSKDSTPEEVAEYRAAHGIPEDPKGYSLDLSEGLVVGKEDREMLGAFLKNAHDSNYTQDQVTSALEWYYGEQERLQEERYSADLEFKARAEDELRLEWGPEYQANRNLMANYLSSDFGDGVGELIVQARLPDGTMLANHPDILRGFVSKARASNPMGALVPGSGTKQMESLIDEIEELEKRMGDDSWYSDKKAQDRYLKLVSVRDKAGAR